MPFFILIFAVILMVAAYKKKQGELFQLLKDDFFTGGGFLVWVLAVIIIAGLGAFKPIKRVSDAFLILVILVIIIKNYRDNQDILTMFISQIRKGIGYSESSSKRSYASGGDMLVSTGLDAANSVLNKAKSILQGALK